MAVNRASFRMGRKRRPWSTTIIVPHVACLRGSWGTLSAEGLIAGADFAVRYPSHAVARRPATAVSIVVDNGDGAVGATIY